MDLLMPPLHITATEKRSSEVPLVADAVHPCPLPQHGDPPPDNLVQPVPNWKNFNTVGDSMRMVCIARHGHGVNVVFLDGHARYVPLEELWTIRWNSGFTSARVLLPRS